ncbi:hypothetical protein BG004_006000 [Podila humilis]|nr:hypothetical protein BG004_006000 [Podila humilis]
MRPSILKRPAKELRQEYLQQYLKHFLRRVHPDLFRKHPKEQLCNSTSLQDLLPLVNHEKDKAILAARQEESPWADSHAPGSSKSAHLVFYYRPEGRSASTELLKQVEHSLPLPVVVNTRIPTLDKSVRETILNQEVKSWEMVQSFLELCRKVGVPVKDPDQKDVSIQLEMSIQEAETKQATQSATQKPIGEIFAEELQGSFSGSLGGGGGGNPTTSSVGNSMAMDPSRTRSMDYNVVSSTHLSKIGGSAPALDAQVMIQSNLLLFQSPELLRSKLERVVRTWIHWQEEDEASTLVLEDRFRLSDWWRKVPVVIMSSAEERSNSLRMSDSTARRGMLIVDPQMSKQDMTKYLRNNLARVQNEHRIILEQSRAATARHVPRPPQGASAGSGTLSQGAAAYLSRMRAKQRPR